MIQNSKDPKLTETDNNSHEKFHFALLQLIEVDDNVYCDLHLDLGE